MYAPFECNFFKYILECSEILSYNNIFLESDCSLPAF